MTRQALPTMDWLRGVCGRPTSGLASGTGRLMTLGGLQWHREFVRSDTGIHEIEFS